MTQEHETQAQSIRRQYADFYRISGGLTLVVLLIWIGSLFFTDGYSTNIYTEITGVLATILVLDQINRWRETQALKNRLLMEVRSPAHDTAVTALEWLRREGWLEPDTFKGDTLERISWNGAYIGDLDFTDTRLLYIQMINVTCNRFDDHPDHPINMSFTGANLIGVTFTKSILEHCQFTEATLLDIDFSESTLNRASFRDSTTTTTSFADATIIAARFDNSTHSTANFSSARLNRSSFNGAKLRSCNLKQTELKNCDLRGTSFIACNLTGANLSRANLSGADLEDTLTDNIIMASGWNQFATRLEQVPNTTLPDGTLWSRQTDLARFTDRMHPAFAETREAINAVRAEMDLPPLD